MVMLLSTSNSPLVKPIVPVMAKLIISPSLASASAWRNEPGPLSFVLVTVIVVAQTFNGAMHSSLKQTASSILVV